MQWCLIYSEHMPMSLFYLVVQEMFSANQFNPSIVVCAPARRSSQTHPTHGAHLDTLPGVEFRPDVEVEARSWCRATRSAGVKVNHVFDLCAAAVNDPVVAIKRGREAENGVDARRGRHSVVFVGKGFELRSSASIKNHVSIVYVQLPAPSLSR